MPRYKAVLLDWDGTVVDSIPVWVVAYKKLFKKHGLSVSTHEIMSRAYNNPKGCKFFGISDCDSFNKELFALVSSIYYKSTLYAGVMDVLTKATMQNIQIALVTSTPKKLISAYIETTGISGFFQTVITRDDVEDLKPNPEGYLKALKNLNIFETAYSSVLVVGDSAPDLIAGQNLGLDTLLMDYSNKATTLGVTPTYVSTCFESLLNYI